jgi:hypothetical protein
MSLFALVTSEAFPGADWADRDTPLLAARLAGLGHRTRTVSWDGPAAVDWAAFDVVVLQSPWSMWRRLPAFARWLDGVRAAGPRLANPYDVIRRGMSKDYLLALAPAVPVVPTVRTSGGRLPPGALDELAATRREIGGEDPPTFVVKPVASGGALDARRLRAPAEVERHVADLAAAGSDACVQPYIATIDTLGEIGAVVIGGEFSHAIVKDAILRSGSAEGFHPNPRPATALSPTDREQIMAAYRAYAATVDEPPASVRLDFLRAPADGHLLLLEIESVAPVRFFPLFPAATEAYALLLSSYAEPRRT